MKNLICMFVTLCMLSNAALANCDWSTIKKLPDGGYEYSPALNLCVGNLVQDNKTKDLQIADLTKAITLKDLALKASDDRVLLWSKTAGDEMDRLNKISEDQKHSDWLYFGLGVATTFLAAYSASKLIHN